MSQIRAAEVNPGLEPDSFLAKSLDGVGFERALVESERRVLIAQQRGVGEDPVNPAVDAHYEIEESAEVHPGEEQANSGDEDQ